MIKELFIEKDWHRDGDKFHHRQVFKNGSIYIYEVYYNGSSKPWYEIFKRKVVADILKIDGKLVRSDSDFHVKYPSNESFGRWAFCCHDKESVQRAINENPNIFEGCLEGITGWLSEAQK